MSGTGRGGKVVPANNVYTVILALASVIVLATAAFVTFKCYSQYGIIFTMP